MYETITRKDQPCMKIVQKKQEYNANIGGLWIIPTYYHQQNKKYIYGGLMRWIDLCVCFLHNLIYYCFGTKLIMQEFSDDGYYTFSVFLGSGCDISNCFRLRGLD